MKRPKGPWCDAGENDVAETTIGFLTGDGKLVQHSVLGFFGGMNERLLERGVLGGCRFSCDQAEMSWVRDFVLPTPTEGSRDVSGD